MEKQTKWPPFFLPQINLKEKSTESDNCQLPGTELDVRGQGVKTAGEGVSNKARRKQKRMRKLRNKVNSFQSPSNKAAAHKIPGFTLPPIDSKSLTNNPAMKNDPGCPTTTAITPQREFDVVFTTLVNVIERSKEEHKRTAEKFQRCIVRGEQKPINEKLLSPWPEDAKSGCSSEVFKGKYR